jgi:hypothetical protein
MIPSIPSIRPLVLVIKGDCHEVTCEAAARGIPFLVVRREVDGRTVALTGPQYEAKVTAWLSEVRSMLLHVSWGLGETIEPTTKYF